MSNSNTPTGNFPLVWIYPWCLLVLACTEQELPPGVEKVDEPAPAFTASGTCKLKDNKNGTTTLSCQDGTQVVTSGPLGAPCEPGTSASCSETKQGTPINYPGLHQGLPLSPCRLGKRTCLPSNSDPAQGKWSTCKDAIAPRSPNTCPEPDCDCNGVPD